MSTKPHRTVRGLFPATLLLIGWGLSGAGQVRADLRFAQPTADVGEVKAGVPLSRRFEFRNDGPGAVDILEARASCGCLTPKLERRTYGPGEQGAFLLEVNTLGEAAGPHSWTVRVVYRAGDRTDELTFGMTGRIVREISLQPAAMTVFADSKIAHTVLLTDFRPKPLGVAAVCSSSPRLKARLTDESRDDGGHVVRKIKVEVGDDYPPGRHQEAVTVFTDDPTYPELRVPVTIVKQSRERVTVSPGAVSWVVEPGRPIPSRVVRVRDREGQAVAIEKVAADHPAVRCTWAKGPGNMATVKIAVDHAQVPGGGLKGSVQIHVAAPVREVVTVAVSCLAR